MDKKHFRGALRVDQGEQVPPCLPLDPPLPKADNNGLGSNPRNHRYFACPSVEHHGPCSGAKQARIRTNED